MHSGELFIGKSVPGPNEVTIGATVAVYEAVEEPKDRLVKVLEADAVSTRWMSSYLEAAWYKSERGRGVCVHIAIGRINKWFPWQPEEVWDYWIGLNVE